MGVIFINPYRFGVFDPLSLSPALWLDAADTSTITASGSPAKVTEWRDKSGNARHVTQGTGVNQPSTGVNTLNALNVLTFDGVDCLERLSTGVLQAVSGATIYVVRQHLSFDANEMNTVVIQFSTTGGAVALIGSNFTANKAQTSGRTVTTDTIQRLQSSANIPTTVPQIQTGWFDYANTDATQYLNATADGLTTSWQSATTTSNVSTHVRIGDNATTQDRGINGYIAEILIYHAAHNASQRSDVWGYLAGKWGITL